MSRLKLPRPVKLVIACFTSQSELLDEVGKYLAKYWGTPDYISDDLDFSETAYYQQEMGENLHMRITSFQNLVNRNSLPDIKVATCQLEENWKIKEKRQINIDPGLLSLENFILATGKGYSHRIYLDKGVYADLTLIYKKNAGYQNLPWTYPNYQGLKQKEILSTIRNIYTHQLTQDE